MKRQRIWREAKPFSDLTSRHAFRAGLHQKAKHFEAVVLSQGGQGRNCIGHFHISMNIEIINGRQVRHLTTKPPLLS